MRLFFVIFNLLCVAARSDEKWDAYQKQILAESPHFPGWCPVSKAEHIMNILLTHPSEVCIEVGVFGGRSFFPMAATLAYKQQGMAYAIDPWDNAPCLVGNEHWKKENNTYWEKLDLNKTMQKFIDGMHKNGLDAHYLIMRMTSQQACPYFADESIDYLHIDGNHSEESSVFDVMHWLPKVKKGGVICFDDAWWDSTQKAVRLLLDNCELMESETSPKRQYMFFKKPL